MEIMLGIAAAAAVNLSFALGIYIGLKGIKSGVSENLQEKDKGGIPIEKQLDNLMNYRGKLSE